MGIERIDGPSAIPGAISDYQAQNNLQAASQLSDIIRFSGLYVLKGAVFNIGGVIYKATADTAIAGTLSNYVKITAAGATATAEYVASLSGVAWNNTYNGYYAGSALVVFDEGLAIKNGQVTTTKKQYSNRINGKIHANSDAGFYGLLALVIPNIGECIRLTGGVSITLSAGVYALYAFSYAERISTTAIRIYAIRTYLGGIDAPIIYWDIETSVSIPGSNFISVAW